MKQCTKCNVNIIDDTDRCPLCRHALIGEDGGTRSYPNAIGSIRKARFLKNLILFISLVASISLVAIEYMIRRHVGWSLIVVLTLLYANLVVRYAVLGKSGYQAKIFTLVLVAILVLLGVDYLTGFKRWSLTYVYPCVVMGVDVAILILMLVNRRNWQSYIMSQIFMFILSLLSLVFMAIGANQKPLIGFIGIGVTLFVLMGTLIFGEERAKEELKRRFHI